MIIPANRLPVNRRLGDLSLTDTTSLLRYGMYALGAWWLWSAFKKGRG